MLLCQLVNMSHFDPIDFRRHFPLLKLSLSDRSVKPFPLVYFDNGATTQKPQTVIDCYQDFYSQNNANVHRSSHALSTRATRAFEQARGLVKDFIHARSLKEVIWTKGTTESINLVAQSYARKILKSGDEIILCVSEHHANIVPWQIVAEQTGAVVRVMPLDLSGRIDVDAMRKIITDKAKIVSFAHISNVLGRINPIKEIITQAKAVGAVTLIDGAQAIAHLPIDVQDLGCDFYVFSAHKMYGPTGVGVLYGRESLLNQMTPYQGGGEMIDRVSFEYGTTYNQLPFKFEAGTPNIAGVVAFSKAIEFINGYLNGQLAQYEHGLTSHIMKRLSQFSEVNFIVQGYPDIPIISFVVTGHHNHDIATALDSFGIAVRSGHHCAMPLMDYLMISGCIRVSLSAYNTLAEIDFFIEKLNLILVGDYSSLEIDNNSTNWHVNNIGSNKNKVLASSMLNSASDEILALFKKSKSWDGRHRQIMLLSKQLDNMPDEQKNEMSLIKGCESLAWLTFSKDLEGNFSFQASSDAKVIRGLLVIVLAAFNHKNSQEIAQFNLDSYFDSLGLMQHLSPSRGNGVKAIVDKIIQITQNN